MKHDNDYFDLLFTKCYDELYHNPSSSELGSFYIRELMENPPKIELPKDYLCFSNIVISSSGELSYGKPQRAPIDQEQYEAK